MQRKTIRPLLIALAAVAALVGPVLPAAGVVGGTAIQVQAAPWSVFITYATGAHSWRCGGAVIDASHVVTAAHCLYGDDNEPLAQPAQVSVQAGVSNPFSPSATDAEQDRTASAVRVHPGYDNSNLDSPDDIAVLALSSPLDLSGTAVKAIALPAAAAPYPTGAAATLAGYGLQSGTDTSLPGTLESMNLTVEPQDECGPKLTNTVAIAYNNATEFCAVSSTSATCGGDSGSGLATTTGPPVLIGINIEGVKGCPAGSDNIFTYLSAPETLSFLSGSSQPPTAPQRTSGTLITLTWPHPLVTGSTLTCSTNGWLVPVVSTYSFINAANKRVLQTGTRDYYQTNSKSAGQKILCQIKVSNKGGTLLANTVTAPPLKLAPRKKR